MNSVDTDHNPQALKHLFDRSRLEHIADQAAACSPAFDRTRFLDLCSDGADALSVMQRMRRVASSLRAALPGGYREQLPVLRQLAPRIAESAFACMALSEYVALHGRDDFEVSMDALRFFTRFGSSEFGIRPFLLHDPQRTLQVMRAWAADPDEHVRRLATEGCRPRLPWAARLPVLAADPRLAEPILQALRADPSPSVRRSVANHLNDIAKAHPAWVMAWIEAWPPGDPQRGPVARHALRTLIKQGDRRALAIVGAGAAAQVEVVRFEVSPVSLALGQTLVLTLVLKSTAATAQKLLVDYTVHYVKAAGHATPKVFKWKLLDLAAGDTVTLVKRQMVRDFSTRLHHAGRHAVDVVVNGARVADGAFLLTA
ncbi:DNA alkylation repair protein [Xylophilus sp. Kf1]|nr:DNA alkylation repair protein [Xylophilus sp. Kf1]